MTRIHVIATGGTISGVFGSDGAISPTLAGAEIVSLIGPRPGVVVSVQDLLAVDSSCLSFADLDAIVASIATALTDSAVDAVVVLHGTDTMEETALLADLFHTDRRPVLFVGALRAADHPESDGPGNIAAALDHAVAGSLVGRGVHMVTERGAYPALGTRKVHTADIDAFAASTLRRRTMPARRLAGTRVDIVALYPGVDRVAIDAFIAAGAAGIVLEAMGSGNANPDVVAAVREHGPRVPFVVSSRVPHGPVAAEYGGGGGGSDLVAAGAVVSPSLRSGQARIALAALLAGGARLDEVRAWFTDTRPVRSTPTARRIVIST